MFQSCLGDRAEFVADGQLSNGAVHEVRIQPLDHVKCGLDFRTIGSQRLDNSVRVLFGRGGNVENVAWLYAGATIVDLLGNNLRNRF